jgi:hypothetical protein
MKYRHEYRLLRPENQFRHDGVHMRAGAVPGNSLLRMKNQMGTLNFMRNLLHRTGVVLLSLWMMAVIPVAAGHHGHPDGRTGAVHASGSANPGESFLTENRNGGHPQITVPCLLCGRVCHPLVILHNASDRFLPVTGRMSPAGVRGPSEKPALHRLRDRSPPGPPTSC